MEFSSYTFLFFFLPITVIAYFLTPKRGRNITLFAANLVFYAWSEPVYVLLLLGLWILDYVSGRLIARFHTNRPTRVFILTFSLAMHILSLLVFKYQIFFPGVIERIFEENNILMQTLVPLGISVYVFQGMSYLIDLYLNKIAVQKNIISLGTYLMFFPQMLCGPIVRYSDMGAELAHREESINKIAKGYGFFIRGLAKKLFLADNMLAVWRSVESMGMEKVSILTAWLGLISFVFALYYYFDGYSDMARGIGKIFGFELPINFNYPFVAKSISEFWRRWNVSLTVWLKSYVFTPLSQKTKDSFFFTTLHLLCLWLLMALWYGGRLNLLLWGLAVGLTVIFERMFLSVLLTKLPVIIQKLYTLFFIFMTWVLFAADQVSDIPKYFFALFHGELFDGETVYLLSGCWVVLILCIIFSSNVWHTLSLKQDHDHPQAAVWFQIGWELFLTIGCLIFLIAVDTSAPEFFIRF
ncbi:MAG: MBOAT family O-acyltransferase [Massiliimalia sp.]|jgi:alginate O-acetyltransferase complex protein AlgI